MLQLNDDVLHIIMSYLMDISKRAVRQSCSFMYNIILNEGFDDVHNLKTIKRIKDYKIQRFNYVMCTIIGYDDMLEINKILEEMHYGTHVLIVYLIDIVPFDHIGLINDRHKVTLHVECSSSSLDNLPKNITTLRLNTSYDKVNEYIMTLMKKGYEPQYNSPIPIHESKITSSIDVTFDLVTKKYVTSRSFPSLHFTTNVTYHFKHTWIVAHSRTIHNITPAHHLRLFIKHDNIHDIATLTKDLVKYRLIDYVIHILIRDVTDVVLDFSRYTNLQTITHLPITISNQVTIIPSAATLAINNPISTKISDYTNILSFNIYDNYESLYDHILSNTIITNIVLTCARHDMMSLDKEYLYVKLECRNIPKNTEMLDLMEELMRTGKFELRMKEAPRCRIPCITNTTLQICKIEKYGIIGRLLMEEITRLCSIITCMREHNMILVYHVMLICRSHQKKDFYMIIPKR